MTKYPAHLSQGWAGIREGVAVMKNGITINPKGFHRDQIKFYCILIPLAVFMALPIVYIISHAFNRTRGSLFECV